MSKVYGKLSDFSYIRKDRSRTIIGYNLQLIDDLNYTWNEIYFYKKQNAKPTIEQIKAAIISEINLAATSEIVEGFEWKGSKVWLTMENQLNYKTAYDLAILDEKSFLPVTFKFGTNEEPVYCTFDDIDSLEDFYISTVYHVNDVVSKAWLLKDSIDWDNYKAKEHKE